MKTILTLLFATLLLVSTPLFASAHGRDDRGGQRHAQGWVKDTHRHGHAQRSYRGDLRHDRRVKHQLRAELRETRRELRHVQRRIHHKKHARRHYKPYRRHYYSNSGVLIGLPHVILRFDL